MMIRNKLYTYEEVCTQINVGKVLVLAGDEELLKKLPQGNWIAGTIPYFMDISGGIYSKDKIFVNDFTDFVQDFKFVTYNENTIELITGNNFENGFTFLILPYAKNITQKYALKSLDLPNIYQNPLVGFVAGVEIDKMNSHNSLIFNGFDNYFSAYDAVALHFRLPENCVARVEIVNIFEQDENSPEIVFPVSSYTQSDCLINGKKSNIYDYLTLIQYDRRLPLIANCAGAHINRDRNSMREEDKSIVFHAPMYEGDVYKTSKPVENYQKTFIEKLPPISENVIFSCNCISNYLFGELEGKKLQYVGSMTFGEIAYQLLNQTLIYLVIDREEA